MARLAIAKGFLAEYAKLDKDARRAVEAVVTEFAARPHAWRYLEKPRRSMDDRIRFFRVNSLWRGVVPYDRSHGRLPAPARELSQV